VKGGKSGLSGIHLTRGEVNEERLTIEGFIVPPAGEKVLSEGDEEEMVGKGRTAGEGDDGCSWKGWPLLLINRLGAGRKPSS